MLHASRFMTTPSEEIKSRLDIVEVISGYIRLQKQGGSFRALCPFHNEKTPSFHVSSARQIWHCFGCGEGGDIFKFVMKMEGMEFIDALRLLAAKAGVELKKQDPALTSQKQMFQEICAVAAQFFQNNLKSGEGAGVLEYLRKRGLKDETVANFKIGYAPESWDALCNFLALRDVKMDAVEKAGLAVVSEKSGKKKYFDRFRGRIMFPIADANGAIVGFTGRYLKEKPNEGKYVNTPQTLIFNKSAILYGIDKTKMEIKKADLAVIVEGQMDAIMAWQDGVLNVAAASGTAFTIEQLNLIKRYTKNICLLFDSDIAGDAAAQRSIALAQAGGFNVGVAMLSSAKDPADFVVEFPGQLAGKIAQAASVMDYYFQYAFSRFNPSLLEDKKKITEILLPKIKSISNNVELYHWLEKLSAKLQTNIGYLEDEMKKAASAGSFTEENYEQRRQSPALSPLDKLFKHLMSLIAALKDDKARLKIAGEIQGAEFYQKIFDDKIPADTANPVIIRVFDLFLKNGIVNRFSEDFLNKLDDSEKNIINEILFESELKELPDTEKEIVYCLSRIESSLLDNELKRKERGLKEAETAGDTALSEQLLKEIHKLVDKKSSKSII